MDKSFLQFFSRLSFLGLSDLKTIYALVRIRRVEAGEVIVDIGEIFPRVIFVARGLLRNYAITSDGSERTLHIASERMATSSRESYFFGRPSIECIQALEPSMLLILDADAFDQLAHRNARLLRTKVEGMKGALEDISGRVLFFTLLTPEERYLDIRANRPDLLQRVPQKHLASYIGVTPVSLSRIKARIAMKERV